MRVYICVSVWVGVRESQCASLPKYVLVCVLASFREFVLACGRVCACVSVCLHACVFAFV